jgi:hypothetical protein
VSYTDKVVRLVRVFTTASRENAIPAIAADVPATLARHRELPLLPEALPYVQGTFSYEPAPEGQESL